MKAFATRLFLVALNLGNSTTQIKNNAEVDATGVSISLPVSVQRATCPYAHSFGSPDIYQQRGCHNLFVI